jgi:hypothetical protein
MFLMYLGVQQAAGVAGAPQPVLSAGLECSFRHDFQGAGLAGESVLLRVVHHQDRSGMAPPGCENVFVLVPVAAGLDDG